MLRRHQEIGRQRHRLPGQHESVRIVRQQHEAHAGEKQVVLQAHQPGWRAFAAPEVAGGEDRNAGSPRRRAETEMRSTEPSQTQMNGQIRQTDGQHQPARRRSARLVAAT